VTGVTLQRVSADEFVASALRSADNPAQDAVRNLCDEIFRLECNAARGPDGSVNLDRLERVRAATRVEFEERDGVYRAIVTVQLPGDGQ